MYYWTIRPYSRYKNTYFAAALGARVIEKHYKISEETECVDAAVSITETQMKIFIDKLSELYEFLGNGNIDLDECEKNILPFRRHTR